MRKVAGTIMAAFVVGAGAMTLLSTVLGAYAEAAALGLVGVGLVASSAVGGKLGTQAPGVPKEA